ncbi:uncharacterized protein DUF3305 [Donghicola tyrosinivorans]|uniref:Uncharacterized protein DUF3305 n=2 Tax=Donghicola tyrosinivorans TaxID=1652492 RepID=A0A2T0WWI1_9RHOB|nr:uncharacterized protein DUF3305 [Donghicola tyrosinivorans]
MEVDILSVALRQVLEMTRIPSIFVGPLGVPRHIWSNGVPKCTKQGECTFMTVVRDTMPMGVVIRRTPGVTRWAKWSWRAVALLPGAGPADWRELRREGEAVEYHAGTVTLELHSSDTDGYRVTLMSRTPSLYVVLDQEADAPTDMPYNIKMVTANAYEGQGYAESGSNLVELVPMPLTLIRWVHEFVEAHHVEEAFVKRKRDKKRVDLHEDGKGDARIRQTADVFRAPRSIRENNQ